LSIDGASAQRRCGAHVIALVSMSDNRTANMFARRNFRA